MKAAERKSLKERVTNLANEQFGDLLKKIRFSGPFEEEDLDVDIILREKISLNKLGAKLWNVSRPLRDDGYDVLIGCEFDERPKKKKTKQKAES
ncbi:MAG: hypothetical protein ACE1ZS_06810 [Candidatus Poribacteria bacterium]